MNADQNLSIPSTQRLLCKNRSAFGFYVPAARQSNPISSFRLVNRNAPQYHPVLPGWQNLLVQLLLQLCSLGQHLEVARPNMQAAQAKKVHHHQQQQQQHMCKQERVRLKSRYR